MAAPHCVLTFVVGTIAFQYLSVLFSFSWGSHTHPSQVHILLPLNSHQYSCLCVTISFWKGISQPLPFYSLSCLDQRPLRNAGMGLQWPLHFTACWKCKFIAILVTTESRESMCAFSRKRAWWCLGLLPIHPCHTFDPLSWYITCWLCEPAKLWMKERVEIGLCFLVAMLSTLWKLEVLFFIQKRGNKAQAKFSLWFN